MSDKSSPAGQAFRVYWSSTRPGEPFTTLQCEHERKAFIAGWRAAGIKVARAAVGRQDHARRMAEDGKRARKQARKIALSGLEASILFPGDHDLAGFASEVRPRKEKIPSHNESPTGKHRAIPKRKSK